MIEIEKIKVDVAHSGHLTNAYLVYDESKDGILIDPGFDSNKIIQNIVQNNVNLKYIVITHGHGDHIGAVDEILKFSPDTKVIIHNNDLPKLLGDAENYASELGLNSPKINVENIISVEDKYTFNVGNLEFEIIHTPGHTSGCICLLEKTSNNLFTGDTIFCNCYGRCDLETGSFENMVESIKGLFERFSDIMIYPGHDKVVNIESAKKKIRLLLALKGTKI